MKKMKRKEHELVKNFIRDLFMPMHKHLGAENSLSKVNIIKNVEQFMIKNKYITKEETEEKYFYKWFNGWINNKLYGNILDFESKHYLRGLCSELINGKAHFYYPVTHDEEIHIIGERKRKLKSSKKMFHLRYEIELPKHMKAVEGYLQDYDKDRDVV